MSVTRMYWYELSEYDQPYVYSWGSSVLLLDAGPEEFSDEHQIYMTTDLELMHGPQPVAA